MRMEISIVTTRSSYPRTQFSTRNGTSYVDKRYVVLRQVGSRSD